MKLLLTRDIYAIDDLMPFKVYYADMESIFQAWNSKEEDASTYVDLEVKERKIVPTHRLLDLQMDTWTDSTIHLLYEDSENYMIPM